MELRKTSIEGLDKLLRDGLRLPPMYNSTEKENKNGLVLLIKGEPGTGKSTLALQLARGLLIESNGKSNVYCYSLEQKSNDLLIKFILMWWYYTQKNYKHITDNLNIGKLNEGDLDGFLIAKKIKHIKYLNFYKKLRQELNKNKTRNGDDKQKVIEVDNICKELKIKKDIELKKILSDYKNRTKKNVSDKNQTKLNDTLSIKIRDLFISNRDIWLDSCKRKKNNLKIATNDYIESIKVSLSKIKEDENLNKLVDLIDKIILEDLSLLIFSEYFKEIEGNVKFGLGENDENLMPLINILDIIKEVQERDEPSDNGTENITIIDGLNIMSNEDRNLLNLNNLVSILRKKAAISIIVYEPGVNDDNNIEYLVDTTIELRNSYTKEGTNYHLHDLKISKSRYQNAVLGWQQYKIREYGLDIFPSIHFQVHQPNALLSEYKKSFKPISELINNNTYERKNSYSIIEDIHGHEDKGGVFPGSTTVILGTRGTFKSTLSLDFLYAGAHKKERGLLISLIDNESTTLKAMTCPRILKEKNFSENCNCELCMDYIHLFHQRPGCITSSELLNAIVKRIETVEKKKGEVDMSIKRLVFWDLTQLEYRFPFIANDDMFIPALMDFCRNKGISLVIMGSENNKFTKSVCAMADNIVFVWRDKKVKNVKENEKNKEYLAILVERSEGLIGSEGKHLKLLGIDDSNNKKSHSGFTLKETPECEKELKNVFEYYRTCSMKEWEYLKNAPDKITKISNIQSMTLDIEN